MKAMLERTYAGLIDFLQTIKLFPNNFTTVIVKYIHRNLFSFLSKV